ncbi:MAG: cysteine methyltransferase [Thermoleophilia bacterium]|nr:cysteine methyltransferase [Thermoleophilia bacterium]
MCWYAAATSWGILGVAERAGDIVAIRPPSDTPATDTPALDDVSVAPAAVQDLVTRLRRYLDGEAVELASHADLARWLDAAGITGFHRDVAITLFGIPRGVTISYGELATLAGRPGAARAVGTACAQNPLPILVPCHRVVHAGARRGDVGSYGAASGAEYKRRLLMLEDAALVRARPT